MFVSIPEFYHHLTFHLSHGHEPVQIKIILLVVALIIVIVNRVKILTPGPSIHLPFILFLLMTSAVSCGSDAGYSFMETKSMMYCTP